jgi:hypothetical protein
MAGKAASIPKHEQVVCESLAGMAANAGLLKSPTIDIPPASNDVTHRYTQDAKAIWIRAF